MPFETDDPASGEWRPCTDFRLSQDPCHGAALPGTIEEYERLRTAWA